MKGADHRAVRDRVNPPETRQREFTAAPCCEHAVRLHDEARHWFFCVCWYLEYCPTHHRVTHVGTHD